MMRPATNSCRIMFSVPAGDCGQTADGRPIGLQIVGQRHDDIGTLRLAAAWERLRPPPRDWPLPP